MRKITHHPCHYHDFSDLPLFDWAKRRSVLPGFTTSVCLPLSAIWYGHDLTAVKIAILSLVLCVALVICVWVFL